jgi:hypothetical protein
MSTRKRVSSLLVVIGLLLFLNGCESLSSLSIGFGRSSGSGKPAKAQGATARVLGPIRGFKNNSVVTLAAATYRGDFLINANNVTLAGRGSGATVIDGDIRISGNGCTVKNLRVRGNVYLLGEKGDVSGAVIEGRVISDVKKSKRG